MRKHQQTSLRKNIRRTKRRCSDVNVRLCAKSSARSRVSTWDSKRRSAIQNKYCAVQRQVHTIFFQGKRFSQSGRALLLAGELTSTLAQSEGVGIMLVTLRYGGRVEGCLQMPFPLATSACSGPFQNLPCGFVASSGRAQRTLREVSSSTLATKRT